VDLSNLKFSEHSKERILERTIKREWIESTLTSPDDFYQVSEDKSYYLKTIEENGDRCLKVVYNPLENRVITTHFDRSLKKRGCRFDKVS
jgi:hypothetical protein